MKTFLITTIAFFAISVNCKAQNWVQSAPNITYNGGNVGIGTTTPTLGLLQINGINDMLSLYNVSNSNIQ